MGLHCERMHLFNGGLGCLRLSKYASAHNLPRSSTSCLMVMETGAGGPTMEARAWPRGGSVHAWLCAISAGCGHACRRMSSVESVASPLSCMRWQGPWVSLALHHCGWHCSCTAPACAAGGPYSWLCRSARGIRLLDPVHDRKGLGDH